MWRSRFASYPSVNNPPSTCIERWLTYCLLELQPFGVHVKQELIAWENFGMHWYLCHKLHSIESRPAWDPVTWKRIKHNDRKNRSNKIMKTSWLSRSTQVTRLAGMTSVDVPPLPLWFLLCAWFWPKLAHLVEITSPPTLISTMSDRWSF